MFCFESYNGTLKSYASAAPQVLHQITDKVALMLSKNNKRPDMIERVSNKITMRLGPLELEAIKSANILGGFSLHSSFNRGSLKFTSTVYKAATFTSDFFICTTEGGMGKIKLFVQSEDHSINALIEEYEHEHKIDQVNVVKATGNYVIKPVEMIEDKLLYMNISGLQLVVKRPNSYEVN